MEHASGPLLHRNRGEGQTTPSSPLLLNINMDRLVSLGRASTFLALLSPDGATWVFGLVTGEALVTLST